MYSDMYVYSPSVPTVYLLYTVCAYVSVCVCLGLHACMCVLIHCFSIYYSMINVMFLPIFV